MMPAAAARAQVPVEGGVGVPRAGESVAVTGVAVAVDDFRGTVHARLRSPAGTVTGERGRGRGVGAAAPRRNRTITCAASRISVRLCAAVTISVTPGPGCTRAG